MHVGVKKHTHTHTQTEHPMRDKAKNSAVKKSYEKRVSCWTAGLETSLQEPVIEQIIA